jgi:uncharacterized protein YuzE
MPKAAIGLPGYQQSYPRAFHVGGSRASSAPMSAQDAHEKALWRPFPTMASMRSPYDPNARAGYIYLTGSIEPGGVKKTIPVTDCDSVILDSDADGHLIGIELLDPALLHPTLLAKANK